MRPVAFRTTEQRARQGRTRQSSPAATPSPTVRSRSTERGVELLSNLGGREPEWAPSRFYFPRSCSELSAGERRVGLRRWLWMRDRYRHVDRQLVRLSQGIAECVRGRGGGGVLYGHRPGAAQQSDRRSALEVERLTRIQLTVVVGVTGVVDAVGLEVLNDRRALVI